MSAQDATPAHAHTDQADGLQGQQQTEQTGSSMHVAEGEPAAGLGEAWVTSGQEQANGSCRAAASDRAQSSQQVQAEIGKQDAKNVRLLHTPSVAERQQQQPSGGSPAWQSDGSTTFPAIGDTAAVSHGNEGQVSGGANGNEQASQTSPTPRPSRRQEAVIEESCGSEPGRGGMRDHEATASAPELQVSPSNAHEQRTGICRLSAVCT